MDAPESSQLCRGEDSEHLSARPGFGRRIKKVKDDVKNAFEQAIAKRTEAETQARGVAQKAATGNSAVQF